MSALHVRAYTPADLPACLALFDGNVPRYFTADECQEFEDFLRAGPPGYLVVEQDGRLLGCGGWALRDRDEARLCWGLAARALHGQGVGRALLQARLQAIRAAGGVQRVTITTSQLSAGFFERFGFVVTEREVDGLAPGLDRVEACLLLTEARA